MTKSLAGDIKEALRSNTAALSTFEGLPPSHKREYLTWITAVGQAGRFRPDWAEREKTVAKRDDTRRRRIAGMIDKLVKGRDGQA
jgi:uncharacterized protein YdeI (YjbR/CyaY-like superfamily)